MKKLTLASAAIALLACAHGVKAADYSAPPPVLHAPPAPWVEIGSNWYIRGDFTYRTFDVPGASGPDDAAAIGLGVGYQFNSWLRSDLSLDYQFNTRFSAGDNPDVAGARLNSTLVLANAYVDLGTWWGVTPYVGAGIGTAFNEVESENRWNFAYALMAGAAYQVSNNLSVDFGYRFADLGNGTSLSNAPIEIYTHEFRVGLRYKLD